MKRTRVQGPDGGYITVEHPEDASQSEILAFAEQNYKPTPVQIGKEGMAKAAKDVGKGLNPVGKIGAGLGSWWQGAAQALTPPQFRPEGKEARDVASQMVAGAGPLAKSAEFAAGMPLAFAMPASTIPQAAGNAAVMGLLNAPQETGREALTEMGKGAALGAGTNLGLRALTGGLTRPTQEAKRLMESGVTPTVGQSSAASPNPVARAFSRFEEKAQSFPFVGDFIHNARERARNQFVSTAINKSLPKGTQPIAERGAEGVELAKGRVGQMYDDVYGSNVFKPDMKMLKDIASAPSNVQVPLSQRGMERYNDIVQRNIFDRLPVGGLPASKVKQTIESDLGKAARELRRSDLSEVGDVGSAVKGARDAVRNAMGRQLPAGSQAELAKLNESWRNLTVLEKAAERAKAQAGMFTPYQLQVYAEPGTALRQFANDAQAVLPNRVPNSGTADRAAAMVMGVPQLGRTALWSPTLMTTPLVAGLYTQLVQRHLQGGYALNQALAPFQPAATRLGTMGLLNYYGAE